MHRRCVGFISWSVIIVAWSLNFLQAQDAAVVPEDELPRLVPAGFY